jgi:hypothetical protein
MKPRTLVLLFALLACTAGPAFAATLVGSVNITGNEQSSGGVWDTGTVTVTMNGYSVSTTYGQFSSPDGIAAALGVLISQNCNFPVYAKATGSTLNFYARGSNVITSASISSTSSNPSVFSAASFQMGGLPNISPPVITALSLPEGPSQMGLVITGASFGSLQQTVTIGGFLAPVLSWSDTQIIVQVPVGAPIGPTTVIVTTWMSNVGLPANFKVDPPFSCN